MQDKIRLDKWLWHARFCRTRSLAVTIVERGKVRVNARIVKKPGSFVRRGDVLTIVLPGGVRVLQIENLAERRGPAAEARTLYSELPDQDDAP